MDEAAGYNEGFPFKADGRGDYLGYFVEIQGDELTLSYSWTLIRQ